MGHQREQATGNANEETQLGRYKKLLVKWAVSPEIQGHAAAEARCSQPQPQWQLAILECSSSRRQKRLYAVYL